ncbi:MAG: hypothetical protein F6K11_08505 [Leptolyngbya sp. SIO3F4]|nr:hypothetical protein [Leptolyngbya sp. SIO3F4]
MKKGQAIVTMQKIYALLIGLAFLSSCSTEETDADENGSTYAPPLEVNQDKSDLDNRIEYFDEPLNLTGKRSSASVTLTKKAEVLPAVVDGYTLSATGVDTRVKGNTARTFVSFHTRGEEYGGEILIMDVANPSAPVLLQSLIDHDADYNDVTVGQHYVRLWVAGDRSVDASGYSNTNGAIAAKFWLNSSKTFNTIAKVQEVPLASYSGNSMTRVQGGNTPCSDGAEAWITSGSNGELRVLAACEVDQNFPLHQRMVPNAKHFDYDGDRGVLLRGINSNSCAIDVYDLDSRYAFTTYTLPYDVTYLGKNGVDVVGKYAYLALGDDGIVQVDLTDGTVVNSYQHPGSGFANSLVVTSQSIYIAYGTSGMVVLDKTNFTLEGSYNGGGSCNFIDAHNGYLYIANGNTGGFLIVQES